MKNKKLHTGEKMLDPTVHTVYYGEYLKCDFKIFEAPKLGTFSGTFTECDFFAASLEECVISGVFNNCDFSSTDFSNAIFRGPRFYNCKFLGTSFIGATGLWSAHISLNSELYGFLGAKALASEADNSFKLIMVTRESAHEGTVEHLSRKPIYLPPSSNIGIIKPDTAPIPIVATEDDPDDYSWFVGAWDSKPLKNYSAVLISSDEKELYGEL